MQFIVTFGNTSSFKKNISTVGRSTSEEKIMSPPIQLEALTDQDKIIAFTKFKTALLAMTAPPNKQQKGDHLQITMVSNKRLCKIDFSSCLLLRRTS
jgi:hypothetical protein